MRKFLKNCRGVGTVLVTLLLIPAILVTGTAVDLASIYTAKSLINDGNQLALNGLLSEYDDLLRDLYGLFAVTADDDEMREIVNRYLALTLFSSDDGNMEGRVLFNDTIVSTKVENVDASSIRTREILRNQIEEFVKLRAPGLFIEGILDTIEAFTKFLPDLNASLLKLEVDRQILLLEEFDKQMYYRMRKHDYYIYDNAADPKNTPNLSNMTNPQGVEVNFADDTTAALNSTELKRQLAEMQAQKEKYDNAEKNLQELKELEELEAELEELEAINNPTNEQRAEMDKIRDEIKKREENNATAAAAKREFEKARGNALGIVDNALKLSSDTYAKDVMKNVIEGPKFHFGSLMLDMDNLDELNKSIIINSATEIHSILGALTNAVIAISDITQYITNPFKWLWEIGVKAEKEDVSKYIYEDKSIYEYIRNISDMIQLRELILIQSAMVIDSIETLKGSLEHCSDPLKKAFTDMLQESPYTRYDIDSVMKLFTRIDLIYDNVSGRDDYTGSYFHGLGIYLENPRVKLGNGSERQLNSYRNTINFEIDANIPADFNLLKNNDHVVQPYFATLGNADKYLTFCNNLSDTDDSGLFMMYAQFYDQYGDDTYFQQLMKDLGKMFGGIFSSMSKQFNDQIKEYRKGIALDFDGEWKIPAGVSNNLYEQGLRAQAEYKENQENVEAMQQVQDEFADAKFGNNGIGAFTAIINLLDTAREFVVNFALFASEGFGLLDKAALTVYGTRMFSLYTTDTDKESDITLRGHTFTAGTNYLLGSEQEYLYIGSDSATANLMATHGIMFAVRFVANLANGFFISSVMDLCSATAPTIIGPVVMYLILVTGETFVDMYALKTGDSIPIFKLEGAWTFGNWKDMLKDLIKEAISIVTIPVKAVFENLPGSPGTGGINDNKIYEELYDLLNNHNTERNYSVGTIYGVANRLYYEGDINESLSAIMDIIDSQASQIENNADLNTIKTIGSKAESKLTGKVADNILGSLTTEEYSYYQYTELFMEYNYMEIETLEVVRLDETYFVFFGDDLVRFDTTQIEISWELEIWESWTYYEYYEEGYEVTRVPLFDDDGNKSSIADKIFEALMPKLDYSDYMWIFMFLVPSDTLTDRIAHLITMNVSNAKLGGETQLTAGNLMDLSRAYTAFSLQSEAKMKLFFMSSIFTGFSQWGFEGPAPYALKAANARGY